jgi:hypothetical protein
MSVEIHRRQFASNIQSDIIRLEKSISRDEDVLKNIKNLNLPQDILKIKQKELQDNICRKKDDIEKLKLSEQEVLSGNKDDEIIKKNTPKPVANPKPKPKKIIYKKPETKHYEPSKRDFQYHYDHMMKITDTIPDYMKRNLEEMPNNKGYIWRGCWFFGKLPAYKGENVVLFEKGRNSMKIHETDGQNYKVYEKIGQDRKNLILSRPLKKHNFSSF